MKQNALALAALLALGACAGDREPPATPTAATPPDMSWARAALERNPQLELLATDTAAGVFTVRDRASGEVRTVKAAELAAVPVAILAAAPTEVTAAEETAEAPAPGEESTPADGTGPEFNYTVERTGGQVRVSGPGVSIVSATGPAAATVSAENGPRTVDPIICDGERVMQLNARRVVVTGDAIIARNGCQLHITNSRITATGTAVVMRNATVHITNSTIEGGVASFDAGPGAKVFLQGATMTGATRRDESAEVHEQGNNQWH